VRRWLAIAVVCATASHSAADPQAQADELFAAGERAYELKDYDAAARSFRAAYDLVKDPAYLFNIAQSFRMAHHCRQARGFYNDFLAAQPSTRSRAAIEGWLHELEPCAAAEDAAERERLSAEHREVAPPPPKPERRTVDRGGSLRFAGVLVTVAGGVSLITGVGYLLDSRSKQADYNRLCPGDNCDYTKAPLPALDREGRAANAVATAGFVVGGVLTAAGVGLYVWGRTRVETIVLEPRPGGATVSAELRF
jgi:tetratricopeptide (TPR) repeat protein